MEGDVFRAEDLAVLRRRCRLLKPELVHPLHILVRVDQEEVVSAVDLLDSARVLLERQRADQLAVNGVLESGSEEAGRQDDGRAPARGSFLPFDCLALSTGS